MPTRRINIRRLGASEVSSGGISEDSSDEPALAAVLFGPTAFCLGPAVAATLAARQAGGTATLCGWDTWFPSSPGPQKKFRVKTLGGSIIFCTSGDACASNAGSFKRDIVGTCSYNVATCVRTDAGQIQSALGGPSCSGFGPPTIFNPTCVSDSPLPDCQYVVVDTLTTRTLTASNVCCFVGGGAWHKAISGAYTETLTNEDTEADAITRCLVANPFGAYGSCAAPCLAQYEQRGNTGFSFVYTVADFRLTAAGLTPNTAYCAEVDIMRRVYGVGAYVLFATMQLTGNTDGAGNLQLDGSVPNSIGFQSYATNARYFPAFRP